MLLINVVDVSVFVSFSIFFFKHCLLFIQFLSTTKNIVKLKLYAKLIRNYYPLAVTKIKSVSVFTDHEYVVSSSKSTEFM